MFQRVLKNAREILIEEKKLVPTAQYNEVLVFFAAMLHDIGDAKYALPGEETHGFSILFFRRSKQGFIGQNIETLVYDLILRNVSEPERYREFAAAVQAISSAVSHSSEMKDAQKVQDLISQYPELAIVQVNNQTSHHPAKKKNENIPIYVF